MSNNPVDKKRQRQLIRVATMCIGALVILYFGINFLKGIDIFSSKTYYYCVFEDAGGLSVSDPVQVNGYKIGKVEHVSLLSSNPVRICAKLLITEDIKIPQDSKFEVASASLLGGKTLWLHIGESSTYAGNGDTLASFVTPALTDGLDDIKGQIGSILASVDTIGTSLKDLLYHEGGSEDLKNTLANLESTTANLNEILAQNKSKISRLVTDMEAFGKTLEEASPKLNNIVDNFDKISDTLAKADIAAIINNANETIEEVKTLVGKINAGEGDVGQLVNNDSLYRNLEATTANLNNLLVDLKNNPKRYVHFSLFGKKDRSEKK